jgi:hypothetical protein
MATPLACARSIALLQAAQLAGAPATDAAVEALVEVWSLTLADLTDAELHAAALAWLRAPDARWWPAPGPLRALAPASPRPELAADDLVLGPDDVENLEALGVVLTAGDWRWLRENGITFQVEAVP